MKYKLRAECRGDVGRLKRVLSANAVEWEIVDRLFPDVEVTFTSLLSLGALRRACGDVVDGHVMAQTVALADEYTGERVVSDREVNKKGES